MSAHAEQSMPTPSRGPGKVPDPLFADGRLRHDLALALAPRMFAEWDRRVRYTEARRVLADRCTKVAQEAWAVVARRVEYLEKEHNALVVEANALRVHQLPDGLPDVGPATADMEGTGCDVQVGNRSFDHYSSRDNALSVAATALAAVAHFDSPAAQDAEARALAKGAS